MTDHPFGSAGSARCEHLFDPDELHNALVPIAASLAQERGIPDDVAEDARHHLHSLLHNAIGFGRVYAKLRGTA